MQNMTFFDMKYEQEYKDQNTRLLYCTLGVPSIGKEKDMHVFGVCVM